MSIESVAMLCHVPCTKWVAALMREQAPDDDLLARLNRFLKVAERDRARWRRTHGRITLAIVGRGAEMQVIERWSPA
jgi:hypothetical protein